MIRKGRFRPINESEGPWLIWSYYWNCWHMRSSTGGAAGYTSDITKAGAFDFGMAKAYHDQPPHRRDAAIPAHKVIGLLESKLAEMDAERAEFAAKVEQVRAALSSRAAA